MKKLIVGSRESKLAVIQSNLVMEQIKASHPEIELEMLTMKTTGDIILDRSLDKIGGKGLFVKELDIALKEGRSDLSVHSLKDMPMEVPSELPIVAYSKREDPRDALVLPLGTNELNFDKPIGCSSQRRMLQLKEIYPEAHFKSIRGNVITRLAKLDQGEYGALILAAAGLNRLGLGGRVSRAFEPEEMIPAAGQGTLAIQGRAEEDYDFLECINDLESYYASLCERSFVAYLNGGCSSPVAAYAQIKDNKIHLMGLFYDEDTKTYLKGKQEGSMLEAEALGRSLAHKLCTECKNND